MTPSGKHRILCVESHPDESELLSTLFTMEGFEVVTAGTAAEAIGIARAGGFDLYLIDEVLPGCSGAELASWITAADRRAGVVMCSADARQSVRRRCLSAGAQAFLPKPDDNEVLIEAVWRVVGAAPGEDEVPSPAMADCAPSAFLERA
jgi:CheY-like chemotaxis protein